MQVKPFETETNVVITDNIGSELNFEFYTDEVVAYGNYQSTGWNDPILASIVAHIKAIRDSIHETEGEVPPDFNLSVQAGKKPPMIKINFNAYSDDGSIKEKLTQFIDKMEKGISENTP